MQLACKEKLTYNAAEVLRNKCNIIWVRIVPPALQGLLFLQR